MKQLQPGDAQVFWTHLAEKHNALYWNLRRYALSPDDVVAVRPYYMADELYEEYKRILQAWLTENDYL